jgi:serine/threonine-protein phosphatase 2B catalytic subunit
MSKRHQSPSSTSNTTRPRKSNHEAHEPQQTKTLAAAGIQHEQQPCNDYDRVMKNVPYPATALLDLKDVFDESTGKPRVNVIRTHFINEGRLNENVALKLVNDAAGLMHKEPNVLVLNDPITIVGDIHGQFYDLLKIFDLGGDPVIGFKYIFLGDYVDRGHFSTEVLLYLYTLKILYPSNIALLRGNHECRHLTEHFTFKRECIIKYSSYMYDACTKSFDCMPLSAIISSRFLCVHGGISPETLTIDDITKINRFREPPSTGHMCDLLWSDPYPDFDKDTSQKNKFAFLNNSARGCSYYYTYNAVAKFLQTNQLCSIIRAHEAQDCGFRLYKKMSNTSFPAVITIFSAPNYLDVFNNKGAIIKFENNIMNTIQYTSVAHPYWLPNFMDVFTWSLPFVVEKTTEMLVAILNMAQPSNRRKIIRQKIIAVTRMVKIYTKIREESETLLRLKGITPSAVSPLNQILCGSVRSSLPRAAKKMLGTRTNKNLSFDEAKELDKENEHVPLD